MSRTAEQLNPIAVYESTIRHDGLQRIIGANLPGTLLAIKEKLTEAAIVAIKNNPDMFWDCDRGSVYNSIVECARRGLIPDGKQGALVPFNTKEKRGDTWVSVKRCQFMIMPQGIIDSLARLNIALYAQSVYENDEFHFWSDDQGQHVSHTYDPFKDRGLRVGAFSAAKTPNGMTYVEVANMDYIKRVMAISKQKDKDGNPKGPWKEWPEKMEQKTAMHMICKRLPTVDIGDDDEYKEQLSPTVSVAASIDEGQAPQTGEERSVPEGGKARPRALQALVDDSEGETRARFDGVQTGETVDVPTHRLDIPEGPEEERF
jgi:recombination protein RecT